MQSLSQEIAKAKELANALQSKNYPGLTDEKFKTVLNRKISNWETSTYTNLKKADPLQKCESQLNHAEWELKVNKTSIKSILCDLNCYSSLQPSANILFWKRKLLAINRKTDVKNSKSFAETLNIIRRNEIESWKKEYKKQLLEWQVAEVQKYRAQLLKDLKEWFETIQKMKNAFDELDIEPGLLWDLSADELTEQDISFLKKWAEYLNKAKNLRKLCELMGRLRKEEKSGRTEIVNSTIRYCVREPDPTSNEMVVGIELGSDLENVIPQELALLSDPDIALLFDLKYVEKRFMCFSKQGFKSEIIEETIQKEVTVVDEEKMGPIIICLDTSDSMAGPAEYVAKALTLSIVSRAVSQKRNCYLINFGTSIETLDITPPKGIRDLIDFLKMSFHGGTDVLPALYEGVRMMQNENYEKADLLVMSDFVFPRLSSEITTLCQKQKLNENRFFALSISPFDTNHIDDGVFDQIWKYNSRRGGLLDITNSCTL